MDVPLRFKYSQVKRYIVQHIYFKEVAKHTIKQTSKITAITTPRSLERTFDPGFGGFLRKQLSLVSIFQGVTEHIIIIQKSTGNHNSRTPGINLWPRGSS